MVGKPYPDLKLVNQDGNTVELSRFKGQVLLVEPVGMTCPACNAFAGAHDVGPFGARTFTRS
ncbi:MAG: redoxin family protein [Armatimonadetes bacterium]|nr:redoxin family protein [Armatimonadota bacterium]